MNYQYDTVKISPYNSDKEYTMLNEYGELGWELVTVTAERCEYYTYYFKRPKEA